MLAELNYGVCTNPYCVGCRGISHDDVEDYLEWEAENLLAGLPKSAGIQISTNVSFSPSIDFKSKHDNALELPWQPIKRKEEGDLSDNAYDVPNTLEQPWQPIKRKREEEPDLLSEWPSLFALSDSEEHPGSPKASSYSPPINISKPPTTGKEHLV
ncbi:hypothetical protein PIB30_015279 [Stylosanthes scabra]|uniref:Uncharacterized protein n=1 Tax=Stylosanthes scabra TaxID=79078 RepID=A0ABU6Y589_9FABA|nr:hypothetical protein [Stylosanthes scabra]